MAAAVPRDGEQLHGILYKLSRESYETLALTEGIGDANSTYKVEELHVTVYPGSAGGKYSVPETVRAVVFSLRYPPKKALRDRFVYPSKRYHTLMVEAAKKAGLDETYVSKLESYPAARVVDGWEQKWGMRCIAGAFFCFRRKATKLALNRLYKPGLIELYSRRERAHLDGNFATEKFWTVVMAGYMLPMVLIGAFHSLGKPRQG
eukprot:Plantae.Rhodophyta-Rhodochaete_pulchella.ctg2229.p1 GENE.Plantae.Rhodophyta-Rhodochaete_pulchella.ctg2229~~Plantae.Rhodophyta-Rhodochaete_pulchella.ctg2229.p1  ORF type:complete len:237 (+),score=17.52 Plantae.Rhodophyta-Rhodochaete_pulchella.ctg2229:98-712(+)